MVQVHKFALKLGVALSAAAFVAGCANTYEVDKVAMMADQGDAFASALHKRYIERAQFEVGEGNWSSVAFFNTRAEASAMGNAPAPQMPGDRNLKVDVDAINAAHGTLAAALGTNAPKAAPDACARAQTWLEHWMEQSEEGHQPDDIAAARSGFEAAMPECKGDAMPAHKPMANMPGSFIVYFDHNSAMLNADAKFILDRAVKAGKRAHATHAVLVGHTDRSGGNAYNMALSKKRAEMVGKALSDMGIGGTMIKASHAGENDPQVAGPDGKREGKNRRVEIFFER